MTPASIFALGFLLGMRHATDADHIAAVATLVTRSRSVGETILQGAAWGTGHTLTLMVFGGVVLAAGLVVPERAAEALELAVGVMLVVLGADVLYRLWRKRVHVHVHRHADGAEHLHAHSHDGSPAPHDPTDHDHAHTRGMAKRALLVGMMHGMAGSAALIVLGLNATLTLALSFSLVKSLRGGKPNGVNHPLYWRRALLGAIATRALGEASAQTLLEELFLAGLLQDIAMLALDKAIPDLYRDTGEMQKNHRELAAHERKRLGFDHAWSERWQMDVYAGPTFSDFNDGPSTTGYSYRAGLQGAWQRTRVSLEASRQLSPYAGQGRLQIQDSIEFVHDVVLPRLTITPQPQPVAVHPVCSVRKMGSTDKLMAIAGRCSAQVVTTDEVQCCGFAGERGFMRPELNEHALRDLKDSLPSSCKSGYSTSRTCEIGLSEMAEMPYESILYLVERCSAGSGPA